MDSRLAEYTACFVKSPGAERSVIDHLVRQLGVTPPSDYLELLEEMDGGEGFVGDHYLRLYPVEKLAALNRAFGVGEFAPGLVIFGSSSGGEAFAFDAHTAPTMVVKVPFIPMDVEYGVPCGATLADLLLYLEGQVSGERRAALPDPELVGREIHEIQPVVFGGDPADPRNKIALSPEEYAQYVVWWNRQYRSLARRRARPTRGKP